LYSSKEVAEIVGLQESRVRYWAQTGVVGPSERKGGKGVYTFQDVVGVKAAKELLDGGLTLQRVRKNLEALKAQLPHLDRPLAQLRIVSDGDRLLVAEDGARFEPLSGQLVLDFQVGPLEGRAAEIMQVQPPAAPSAKLTREDSAYAWFLEGTRLDADPATTDQALIAYQKALDGDPRLAAAHTNLGNLLYRRGELADAAAHYEAALELDGEQPEARYNLGNLRHENGDLEGALADWFRVVADCPEFADAHFNLAMAFVRDGSAGRARVHLERYLALDAEGSWADKARQILETL
jgi:tetratricopeptide (TPR) repeat protein